MQLPPTGKWMLGYWFREKGKEEEKSCAQQNYHYGAKNLTCSGQLCEVISNIWQLLIIAKW